MSKLDLDFFENIFLYKCCTDKSYLASVIDHTSNQYFKSINNKIIFNIIKEFYDKRDELPNLTEIKQYLVKEEQVIAFKDVLKTFQTLDKTYHEKELYDNTERFLKEKSVYQTMLDVASKISQGDIDTANILDQFDKCCNISLQTDKGLDFYDDVDKFIDTLLQVNKTIPSKWPWLDEQIGGGFIENGRSLYVFVGETNIGKSIFLGNIAANIAEQNKTVLLITLEMSEMLYAQRICSKVTKIPLNTLHLETDAIRDSLKEIREKTPNGKILIKEFPPSTVTSRQIQAFIKKLIDKGIKFDAIVIDYLNLLHSTTGNNSYERIKYVTEQVRAMSYIFNCPIISASQLNRSGFNTNNPDLTTVSECIEVNQKITLKDGTIKCIGEVQPGDQITANDIYKTVRQVHHKKIKRCFKITTKAGKSIIVSGKHKFPTPDGRISIEDGLKIGSRLNTLN